MPTPSHQGSMKIPQRAQGSEAPQSWERSLASSGTNTWALGPRRDPGGSKGQCTGEEHPHHLLLLPVDAQSPHHQEGDGRGGREPVQP